MRTPRTGRGQAGLPEDPENDGVSASIPAALTRVMGLIGGLSDTPTRLRLAAALALTLASKVLSVAAPLVVAAAVNRLAGGGAGALPPLFLALAAAWAALRLGATALPQWRDAIFTPVSQEAQRRIGARVFAHVHALSIRYHQSKRTGALYRTIERGMRSIDFLLRFLGFNIIPTLLELALAAIVLAIAYHWGFAAIAAGAIGLYAWLTLAITEWRIQHRREMNEADTEASGRAVDSLLNFETVKSFAAEARETARFDRALATYASAAVKANGSLVLLNITQMVVMNGALFAMVALAGVMVVEGRMGPGDVMAVVMMLLNIYQPLNVLGMAYREIKQSSIDVEKMFGLLDEPIEVADAPGAPPLADGPGEVRFEHVSFAHAGREAGLSDISFVAEAGKTTALVGASGAGKSTILKLLFRFYDPASGRILIDGQDIAGVTQSSLRASLGLVPQDVVLFNDTLRYNIAYARPDADETALIDAARRAQLGRFIAAAPHGWATRVGERGLKLSGGEKQRAGIARVILMNPRILILDEATSSLDSLTEAEVQTALAEASRGRTTLVVAHRLSTIASADKIIVLSEGRIVETGAHADLIARDGAYAALWRMQAEKSIDVAAE